MKNENLLLIIVAAVVAIFLLKPYARAATPVNSAAGINTPQQPSTQTSNIDAISDGVQLARDTLSWAADTFGGWGLDEEPANGVESYE